MIEGMHIQKKLTLSQQKHLDIIGAAKKEFIEHGFLLANMSRIASYAQVSKRTLYRHFENKEILFESVLIDIYSSVNKNIQYQFNKLKSTERQLNEIAHEEMKVINGIYGMSFSRTIVMEFIRQPTMANKFIKNSYSNRAITLWMNEAIDAGRLKRGDTELMTEVYLSLLKGLLFWPQVMNLNKNFTADEVTSKINTVTSVFVQSYGLK